MDPATLAMMYAANVGINALGGKRGSNLFKDSFKDTTTQALTLQLTGGLNKQPTGIDQAGLAMNIADTSTAKVPESLKGADRIKFEALEVLPESQKTISITPESRDGLMGIFDKTAGIFKSEQPVVGDSGAAMQTVRDMQGNIRNVPITSAQMDPLKVGLGAAGAAGVAYGLGAFDPVPPPEPDYPGYNKFYAQNPGQFMPYDDPTMEIDYSKYPDKPYSGIKAGGIIGLEEGGAVGLEAQINQMKKTPEGLRKLSSMIPGSVTEFKTGKDNTSMFSTNEAIIKKYIESKTKGLKAGGIIGLEEGGMPAPDLLKEEYDKYKAEKEAAGEDAMDFNTYKIFKMQFPGAAQGGIAKLAMGGRASNMPMQSIEETTAEEDIDVIPPPMSSIQRPPIMPGMLFAAEGSLVDRLPSKTNTDENNTKNYKRTSGKLVVDAAGKGNEEKDTMLAQLADGEFVTKSKAVRGAGIALGANPKDKKQQRELGARFFYKQMADFDKLAKRMS